MAQQLEGTRFAADPFTFVVRHELWDGNIQDHADQGIVIDVAADMGGKETAVLRFNCFDIEKSYVYGPENADLKIEGPAMLGETTRGGSGAGHIGALFRMDPIIDGNPVRWTVKTLATKMSKMIARSGYPELSLKVDVEAVKKVLPDVEACATQLHGARRNTVKHNRGTHIFEAGNIRFGLEMRRLPMGDGGLAIHVLGDVGGSTRKTYVEETELLAFDCFWDGAHYHYGPRNKNHRIYWDTTLIEDPLEWTLEQFDKGLLPKMIERAGYPGIAADVDNEKIADVLPAMKEQARKMWRQGYELTGKWGLPEKPTPNLVAD